MFTYPENILPLPSHNFDVDSEFSNIRSKMDSGRARQRPRFSGALELSGVRFELNTFQRKIFKSVWTHKLNNGNDWFTMRLPLANGEDLTLTEIRFVSDLKENHLPVGNWDLSARIEYREPTVVSEDILDLHIGYGEDLTQFHSEMGELETIFPKDWEQ